MLRSVWIVAALIGVLCIVALLIAPLVDPPATRPLSDSSQLVSLCWAIAAVGAVLISRAPRRLLLHPSRMAIPAPAILAVRQPFGLNLVLRR